VRVFSKTKNSFTGEESVGANTDDINAGIRWAIRNVAGKGVINLSIGDDLPVALGSAGFADGVEEAWSAGWVTALAAGNEGNLLGLNGEDYGDLDAVVVGATGPSGAVASYSSPIGNAKWGVVAPGGDASDCRDESVRKDCILSTYAGGQYAFLEGTSMATPHVAGGLALLMSAGLSNASAVQRLLATLDSTKTCGSGCKGRLDVAKAVSGLPPATGGGGGGSATTAPPPPTTAASSSSPVGSGSVRPTATTTRRAAGSTGATTTAPAPSTDATPAPSPVEETTSTTPGDVQPLSIDEAAGAAPTPAKAGDDDDRSVPIGLGLLAAVALVGVVVPTVRRARGAAGR
jgi:serine protease